MYKQVILGL